MKELNNLVKGLNNSFIIILLIIIVGAIFFFMTSGKQHFTNDCILSLHERAVSL